MPRFFFDLQNGETQCHDDEGQEMPSMEAAMNEAISVLPEILLIRRSEKGSEILYRT